MRRSILLLALGGGTALAAESPAMVITGTDGDDELEGTSAYDATFAAAGDDRHDGRAGGEDLFAGNPGDDPVFGGNGDDLLLDGAGSDLFSGGAGDDRSWCRSRTRSTAIPASPGSSLMPGIS